MSKDENVDGYRVLFRAPLSEMPSGDSSEPAAGENAGSDHRGTRHRTDSTKRPPRINLDAVGEFLPGGNIPLILDPQVPHLVNHRNARYLHGILTAIIGAEFSEAYTAEKAGFALKPNQERQSWDVWIPGPRSIALAGQSRSVTWDAEKYNQRRVLHFGDLEKIKTPPIPDGGIYTVSVHTRTCVVVKTQNQKSLVARFPDHTLAAMLINIAKRIGVQVPFFHASVVSHELDFETTRVKGGTWTAGTSIPGHVGGLFGDMTVNLDHHALWLLQIAEAIGFGAYTSIGFGRIRFEVL